MVRFDKLPAGYKECSNCGLGFRGMGKLCPRCIRKECPQCGTIFKPYRTTDRFCSEICDREFNKEKRAKKRRATEQWSEGDREDLTSKVTESLDSKAVRDLVKAGKATMAGGRLQVTTQQEGSHGKGGWYEDPAGRRYWMKSSWERNYARYLDFLKEQGEIKEWHYEPKFFEFPIAHGTTRYLPDFQVIRNDGSDYWVEVKGYIDSRAITKMNRMAKHHPEVEMQMVDKDLYYELYRQLKNLIPGWESLR